MTSPEGPLGATWRGDGTEFRVFSSVAEGVDLCLFDGDGCEHRMAMRRDPAWIWSVFVPGVGPGQAYGFRVHGAFDPARGLRCNPAKLLVDPYAKAVSREILWGQPMFSQRIGGEDEMARDDSDSAPNAPRSYVIDAAFDWGDDRRPRHPPEQTIVYELHVKGFTRRHPGVPPPLRGTFAGLATPAAIQSIRELGVTTLELMPVQHFAHDSHLLEQGLKNYWGYQTFGFFAPHAEYSCDDDRGGQVREFKQMVQALHAAGLEVILDVVYNHTAEGNHLGPTLNFKGLDNHAYYHLSPEDPRYYMDYTGTGNSLNIRHPYTLQLVMDSLRYWAVEMHVDGFRFDLATTLARAPYAVDTWSAFFATIHQDPVLQHVKLIAEPWDVGDDGYHAGHFPYHWSEWNDKFRESMRTFWLGGPQPLTDVATRLTGSADLFDNDGRPPSASINYLASHDGLTLADLAGADRRTVQNLLASLFLSMGTPMLMAGDEWGRSQKGCANAYDQDNEVSWLDWATADEVLRASVRRLIAVRPSVPWLRADRWPREDLEISWTREDGESLSPDDWQQPRTSIAMIGRDADGEAALLLNTAGDEVVYTLPPARTGAWRVVMSTACDGEGSRATSGDTVTVAGRSVVLAVGVKIDDT